MKKLLFVLGGIIVLIAVAGLVMVGLAPQDFGVEREVVIDKPKAEVFDYVRILKNQNEWGPWVKKDPNIKLEYRGNDGEVGFVSAWTSKKEDVGSGEQEIKRIDNGRRIDYELRFREPFESKSDAWIAMEDAGANKTRVKWGFKGKMPAPFNALMLFVDMEGPIAKDFDEGLADLKKHLEAQ